jgi:hypothetical protein
MEGADLVVECATSSDVPQNLFEVAKRALTPKAKKLWKSRDQCPAASRRTANGLAFAKKSADAQGNDLCEAWDAPQRIRFLEGAPANYAS